MQIMASESTQFFTSPPQKKVKVPEKLKNWKTHANQGLWEHSVFHPPPKKVKNGQ